ncbi:hypothetical protein M9458_011579, partial [Cirrhinus mrigala]
LESAVLTNYNMAPHAPWDSLGSSVNTVLLDSPGKPLMVDPSPLVCLATAINMGPAILRQ